uniref:DUF834 domain-containing protein n=1 Tax=Oryza meridionalis TaxID=40149 RepID=A0A0E0C6Q6_9ORYZ
MACDGWGGDRRVRKFGGGGDTGEGEERIMAPAHGGGGGGGERSEWDGGTGAGGDGGSTAAVAASGLTRPQPVFATEHRRRRELELREAGHGRCGWRGMDWRGGLASTRRHRCRELGSRRHGAGTGEDGRSGGSLGTA